MIAVIAARSEFARLSAARDRLSTAIGEGSIVKLVGFSPEPNLAAQQDRPAREPQSTGARGPQRRP